MMPNHTSARFERRVGQRAHEADAPSAIDDLDAVPGQGRAGGARSGRIAGRFPLAEPQNTHSRLVAVAERLDGDRHRPACAHDRLRYHRRLRLGRPPPGLGFGASVSIGSKYVKYCPGLTLGAV